MNPDSEIEENVIDALNWDAAFDSSQLTVSIKDRSVTPEGQVRNYSEKLEACRTAQSVAGVGAVIVRIGALPGSDCLVPESSEEVADATRRCLLEAVPAAQQALLYRARFNRSARRGEYDAAMERH